VPDENDVEAEDGLETPADPEAIWRVRGEEVDAMRPIIQGDVFEGVVLPELDDAQGLVMIVDHPCSMRRGARLRERVQVVRVRDEPGLPRHGWPTGQYRLMPLPELVRDRRCAGAFDETTMVPIATLLGTHRIGCLSEYGILVLQQRLVHHLTRVAMRLQTLRRASIHVLEEVDLQEDWNLALATSEDPDQLAEALRREATEFDAFMNGPLRDDGEPRRAALKDELRRSDVRRSVQREIARRRDQAD
jgi:hypothetical protein